MSFCSSYALVTRFLIRARLGASMLPSTGRYRKIGLAALIVVGLGSVPVTLFFLMHIFFEGAAEIGMAGALLAAIYLAAMLVVLLLGIFTMVGIVFNSRDTEFFASLPIRPGAVFLSQMTLAYIYELFTLLFTFPAMLAHGLATGAGVFYYILSTIILLLLPICPLCIAALLSLALSRLSSLLRRRELMITVLSLLLVFAALALSMGLQSAAAREVLESGDVVEILSDNDAMIRLASSAFPPAMWAAEASTGSLSALLLFLLCCGGSLALVSVVCGPFYARAASRLLESRKHKSRRMAEITASSSSPIMAIFKKEWTIILRVSVYALNGLVGIIIFPVMVCFTPLMGGAGGDMASLLEMLSGLSIERETMLVCAGIMCFTSVLNPAASTVFSREGRAYQFMRSLPISFADQVKAKFLFGMSITAAGALASGLAIYFAIGPSAELVAYAFVLSLSAGLSCTAAGMCPDIIKPKLRWNNETEAIKQNLNSILGMLLSLAVLAAYGLIAFVLLGMVGSVLSLAFIMLGLTLAGGFAACIILLQLGETRLARNEG